MSNKVDLPPLDSLPLKPFEPVDQKPKLPLVLYLPISLILLSITFVYAYSLGKNNNPPISAYPTSTVLISPTTYPTAKPYVSPTGASVNLTTLDLGDVSWLSFPKVISINAFKEGDSVQGETGVVFEDIKYHHVGNFTNGSKLINAYVPREGMGIYTSIYRFVETPEKSLYLINDKDTLAPYSDLPKILDPQVGYTTTDLPGILAPEVITNEKGTFKPYTPFGFSEKLSFTELEGPQFVMNTDYGRLYVVYTEASRPGLFDRLFWLRLSDDTIESYRLIAPFVTDDNVPQLSWSDGTSNKQVYGAGFKGQCGALSGKIVRNSSSIVQNLVPVGTNSQGDQVYKLADDNHQFVKDVYDMLVPNTRPDYAAFTARHNHFLWQDTFSDWWFFISEEDMVQAECAKPVIYLYPTHETSVSVKVAANVTKSDPEYPQEGWRVTARPDGQLDYKGIAYPNLFWEGTGHGLYPNKDGVGFVVPQSELVSTLKSQLRQLGLNTQESADFMDFWQPKLPQTPFIRLTWLDTDDMNQLAPLQVIPAPKTAIRIFLDFEGLEKPIQLSPQKLSAPKRDGFTLVEWGGLLVK